MKENQAVAAVWAVTLLMAAFASADALTLAADRLVQEQDPNRGWREFGFTGEVVVGLANMYEMVPVADYLAAAEAGGNFILGPQGFGGSGYNPNDGSFQVFPFAGEVYALSRLADVSTDPKWMQATIDFFEMVAVEPDGADGFIDQFEDLNSPTSAVYDTARVAVAAAKVGASDTEVYRRRLMQMLPKIADGVGNDPNAPTVTALGVAVWALARTGPLDSTRLPAGPGSLASKMLSELPPMLAGHQDLLGVDGDPGDFYWLFGHGPGSDTGGPVSGFTETTAMATLGLIAAQGRRPSYDFNDEIAAAIQVLSNGVDSDGKVFFEIGASTGDRDWLAGETLEATNEQIPEPGTLGVLATLLAGLVFRRSGVAK